MADRKGKCQHSVCLCYIFRFVHIMHLFVLCFVLHSVRCMEGGEGSVHFVTVLKVPFYMFFFLSISHSCQKSNNTVLDRFCPKPIPGLEFQLSKSCSIELS